METLDEIAKDRAGKKVSIKIEAEKMIRLLTRNTPCQNCRIHKL
jgi:hypothetical protein